MVPRQLAIAEGLLVLTQYATPVTAFDIYVLGIREGYLGGNIGITRKYDSLRRMLEVGC